MTMQMHSSGGDFRTTYAADTVIFPTPPAATRARSAIALLCLAPLVLGHYALSLLIQIGFSAIAALGLNILVGFTGQISIGHAAFFGLGAFASAYLSAKLAVPVFFASRSPALITALAGLVFGLPAARLKGLYLAIATLAAQFILQDFFARAAWFTGGVAPAITGRFASSASRCRATSSYFYVVLAWLVVMFVAGHQPDAHARRARAGGGARPLSLAPRSWASISRATGRCPSASRPSSPASAARSTPTTRAWSSSEGVHDRLFSILFLAIVIIGGLGSIMGTLMGAAFMVLLPEAMDGSARCCAAAPIDHALALRNNIAFLREIAIGARHRPVPDLRAGRPRASLGRIKAYWKLYPFSN